MITKDVLRYKGFVASVHIFANAAIYYGLIHHIDHLMMFEGKTIKELTTAFHMLIDELIQGNESTQVSNSKPYNEQLKIQHDVELDSGCYWIIHSSDESGNI